MMISSLHPFKEIWLVDFEFHTPVGEQPVVVCLVAIDTQSGQIHRLFQDELATLTEPPYGIGTDALFVAYYASDEMNCHLSLGWALPTHVLDLFTEFRNLTNGLRPRCGTYLLGALTWFGLPALGAIENTAIQELAKRGAPFMDSEKSLLLNHCQADVDALAMLLPAMVKKLDIPRALLRGRYMKAVAHMEYNGIPVDTRMLSLFKHQWQSIQSQLIKAIDAVYHVYEDQQFKASKFADWLTQHNIPWPRTPSGALELKDDTFKAMAQCFPVLAPLRELRLALSQLRLSALAVGKDGRNRCSLSPFRARTGRNQPSSNQFIFGPSVWLRGLIKPKAGYGLAYIDWSQQEFGIAAALSRDQKMMDAYISGDPYLAFAKQAGAVPMGATRHSHKAEREQFKACVLAVQYGMGAESLAIRIGQPTAHAKALLALHKQTYGTFWKWSDAALDHAMIHGKLWTVFGWTINTGTNPNPRFLRNFLMQGNGSEMLRLACCMTTEAGIKVCAPVHDAIMIEAPLDLLTENIRQTQQIMADASAMVLDDFMLRTDVDVIRYPDRFTDERGELMWRTVQNLLSEANTTSIPGHQCNDTSAPIPTRTISLSVE